MALHPRYIRTNQHGFLNHVVRGSRTMRRPVRPKARPNPNSRNRRNTRIPGLHGEARHRLARDLAQQVTLPPPETLAAIRNEMEALQLAEGGDAAGVDYLSEIPLGVAKSLVGFKHDEICTHLIGGCFDG